MLVKGATDGWISLIVCRKSDLDLESPKNSSRLIGCPDIETVHTCLIFSSIYHIWYVPKFCENLQFFTVRSAPGYYKGNRTRWIVCLTTRKCSYVLYYFLVFLIIPYICIILMVDHILPQSSEYMWDIDTVQFVVQSIKNSFSLKTDNSLQHDIPVCIMVHCIFNPIIFSLLTRPLGDFDNHLFHNQGKMH